MMKVEIEKSYAGLGEFDLDLYSDELLGALIRALLLDSKREQYRQVMLKVVREECDAN
jgi:hypothetical protein